MNQLTDLLLARLIADLQTLIEQWDKIQKLATENHTTAVEIICKFIKLGLYVVSLEEDANTALIIRDGNQERELFLFL